MATPIESISSMLRVSGLSRMSVSKNMGRNGGYLTRMLQQGSTPSADILAEIAAVCGYQLQLVGHGETIVIDPPERS